LKNTLKKKCYNELRMEHGKLIIIIIIITTTTTTIIASQINGQKLMMSCFSNQIKRKDQTCNKNL